jgi:GTP-binding protein
MFIDTATIHVQGGHGGRGCVSFYRTKENRHGTPDGANGGRGGDVILRADRNLATLIDCVYQSQYRAEHGANGGSTNKQGRRGEPLIVRVPVGTIVRVAETGEELADLREHGQDVVVARGGRGGFGNLHYKSSTNRSPRFAENGEPGELRVLNCELKILADIGLVGYPNAGKSTLISAVTRAHSKIAAYPFTTLQPILGLLELPDFSTAVIADIPGLVEGAHHNVGLGHDFLKHIERCKLLVLLLDMAGVDQRDPCDDYRVLLDELARFNADVVAKPMLVAANKMDLPEARAHCDAFRERFPAVTLFEISARDGIGLEPLVARLADLLHASAPAPA